MNWIIWISVTILVLIGVIALLYKIGKDVKEKESMLMKMMDNRIAKDRLKKYKRKSTPKSPTIHK